jgi:transposase
MITLLCEANAAVSQAHSQQLTALPARRVAQFQARYDAILEAAAAHNSRRPRAPGQRGRVKQAPAFNLIARLRKHRDEVLRFLSDLRVPFDNDQAERDFRMPKPKPKQKVSGCFRAASGSEQFATIRSYLSTLRKQRKGLFQSLLLTFQGSPPMPQLE